MKKNTYVYVVFLVLFGFPVFAQVQIDKQLQMTGSGSNAEITGVKTVAGNQDAVSVDYIQRDSLKFAIATGSGTSASPYVVALTPAVTTAYTVGMIINFKAPASCPAGPVYVQVNSLSAKVVKKQVSSDLAANDILANQFVSVIYDGANFQMLSQLGNVAAAFLPTVISTTAASALSGSTAASGGVVSSNGGAAVTAYGVCWSTSANPVLGVGNYTTDGAGTGVFTSNITGLSAGTTYYVRAYATNSVGTAYAAQISFTTFIPIGTAYGGGIVAYILQSGDAGYNAGVEHGLIAATSDQSSGIQWYDGTYTTTGATSGAIGAGANNTALIIASQGSGSCGCYAASLCHTYSGGSNTDWYLPSLSELNELYLNQAVIGGFSSNYYWSSTEWSIDYAFYESFANGNQSNPQKNATYYVRCVRSF